MNLTTGKWIPVVWEDGWADRVSLLDAFQHGDRIRDLAVRPHERVALMRLLICVAQAALDGPGNREEWETCRSRLPQAAAEYLRKWSHAFELFGEGQRFLQMRGDVEHKDEADFGDASKLDLALAAGNNTTLFDNAGGGRRHFTDADLALNLLTYQNYSPLVGRGYKGRSPCIEGNMLHTFLLGQSLSETLWLNLLTVEQVQMFIGKDAWSGRPPWEEWAMVLAREAGAVERVRTTYLGRMCPVQRAIWLGNDKRGMQMGNALEYPAFREASASFVARRDGTGRAPLSIPPAHGIWRELPSIVVKATEERDSTGGPLALHNVTGDQGFVVWTGALVSDGRSKLLDALEGVYSIPGKMLTSPCRSIFQEGVHCAVQRERALQAAIAMYRLTLKDPLDGRRFRNRGTLVKQKAASHYWTAIEQKVSLLLALAENPAPLRPEGAERNLWGAAGWGRTLAFAARQAYELACPRGTPRQLKAYTLGLAVLFKPAREEQEAESAAEEEKETQE